MADQESLFDKIAERCFQGIGTGACLSDHVACRHPAMGTHVVQDLDGQLRVGGECILFTLNFDGQVALLLLQGTHEEHQPRLPVWSLVMDGGLRLAQG